MYIYIVEKYGSYIKSLGVGETTWGQMESKYFPGFILIFLCQENKNLQKNPK